MRMKDMKYKLILPAVSILSALACTSISQTEEEIAQEQMESMISAMSIRQKVAQLFIVRPESIHGAQSTPGAHGAEAADSLAELPPVCGYCIFSQNFSGPSQLDSLVKAIKQRDSLSLICIDEEGGRVARIAGNMEFDVPRFPSMKFMGRRGPDAVYNAGISIGTYLRQYGIDVDFAPVADVDTNPDNPVIGTRAFSSDPLQAGELMMKFLEGLNAAGTIGCLKHFPGHGDTATDSHLGMAASNKTWEEMLSCEIIPFKKGIASGARMIMIGHITTPEVSGDNLPATLSKTLIDGKLRTELDFDGIVITDAMEMEAITQMFTSAQSAVMAIEAGADIVLMPKDFEEAYYGLLDAVESGRIPVERIDASLRRILRLKSSLH